ncbi:formate--tetrahydrofolate ligase [Erythrobacter arachoides]|uniref:Formate--tetrahydrofolate ligase n=1 Tax=Aurantiacibacter arachoides TaxID=1850444 RepID=A0A845A2B4_9SPHN|nr:formate--tetrahydrofolate ligase [Aurantiacibacter arachoides]MXO93582.1 formate--tetrahydrofolate ligase [Aurantiacibacter arachoides]GGD48283.1 formate--tetrahydrofolate ligase [Aurantiacibacter arachoides]
MPTDIEIARQATLLPITDVAKNAGVPDEALIPYGKYKAKVDTSHLSDNALGKLILVTAINPTPAGEGKTTTSVGLSDALHRIGKKTMLCLREPSLGPCFGMKGGGAGGGKSQVMPMDEINLHFTGDFHAITSAHNLLAAMIDNSIYWGNPNDIDLRRVVWKRVLDMNDRALRQIVGPLGGVANGFPRESGFDITVASEIMAILCLATDLADLQKRLGDIIVAYNRKREPVYCRDIKADSAMTVLLKDAILPNLVQTLENNPAFLHGGPFANIAHGCNSVIATKTAMRMADYTVTEAGFGADLGAEKFMDIKCRLAGLKPDAIVIVATVRALKMNGGVAKNDLGTPNADAVRSGAVNLKRHIENLKKFGVTPTVAINHFYLDTDEEIAVIQEMAAEFGTDAVICKHWADGSAGAEELARIVAAKADAGAPEFHPLYPDDMSLADKIRTVGKEIYRADEVHIASPLVKQLEQWEQMGYGKYPVCMAKTQYSFTTDPTRLGAPTGHEVEVNEVRLSAGAGFVVAVCGGIMTMPGLPKVPSAENIYLDENGQIEGLF